MFNRKYKKGMADAAKAYQDFGKKQEEALTYILEEVRQGNKTMEEAIKDLGGHLDGLYDHLKSQEKAKLYTVYTPFDIKALGEKERLFLLGALLRLTVDKTPNENQQNYIRAIQHYLDVKEPPFGVDPMAIENIEDLPSQKAILQTVLEYLRLQDGDSYDETELQQEFLDSFSVSGKARNEIVNHVELLYGATGAQGLAEKYGFVPEEEYEEVTVDEAIPAKKIDCDDSWNYVELSEDQIADIFDTALFAHSSHRYTVICETQNYIIYSDCKDKEIILSFHKSTCKTKDITNLFSGLFPGPYNAKQGKLIVSSGGDLFPHQSRSIESVYIWKDTLFFDDGCNGIWRLCLPTKERENITKGVLPARNRYKLAPRRGGFLESSWLPFLKDSKLYVINNETKELKPVRYKGITITDASAVTGYRNCITFFADIPYELLEHSDGKSNTLFSTLFNAGRKPCLCCYNTMTKETTILFQSDLWGGGTLFSINNGVICYENILGDCVEVVTIKFEDDIPTAVSHSFKSDTRKEIGTEYFVDKDFVGFISAENDRNLYKYDTESDKFVCVAKRCGKRSSFDERLFRIGNYIYMRDFNDTIFYRININEANQEKLILK